MEQTLPRRVYSPFRRTSARPTWDAAAVGLPAHTMKKEIIINDATHETRIAILEDGSLVELYVERPEKERMVGDIYKGQVENVLPGMMAAFVDIGHKQNAFLHFSDIGDSVLSSFGGVEDENGEEGDESQNRPRRGGRRRRRRRAGSYRSGDVQIKSGQDLMVQIIKEPISTKGARVTTDISLPGRFMVLVPNNDMIGVSRKIENFRERRRLKRIAREIKPDGFGMIVRTVATDKDKDILKKDLDALVKTWKQIEKDAKKDKAPIQIYQDLSMASSVIRDLFTPDINRVIIDSKKLHKRVTSYLKDVSAGMLSRVELHRNKMPIYDHYGIESEIDASLERKVWIKGGGYLIIEHTEAMLSVDVNSGKFIGRKDHEQNSLKVNMAAARETARQLRLRDIGGLIVVDFIDMEEEGNRKRLYDEMRRELRKDRAKTAVLELSDFGLMQMTRQRIRPSLLYTVSEPCQECDGTGRVLSKEGILTRIERWLARFKVRARDRRLRVTVHPEIAPLLSRLRMLFKFWISLEVETDPNMRLEDFKVWSKKREKDITEEFLS
jgi:ribonuclease G